MGLVRSGLDKNHSFNPIGGPAGQRCDGEDIFPAAEMRGHDLETGSTTDGIALEPCKILKLKVPEIFICWDFPLHFENFCHLEETAFVYTHSLSEERVI